MSERINIKDLTFEEPPEREELLFDPEKEITEKDWQQMKDELEACRTDEGWSAFAMDAMYMKVLFPERAIELNLDDKGWQGILNLFEKHNNIKDWRYLSWLVMRMKILFPERFSELKLDEHIWEDLKNRLSASSEVALFVEDAMALMILYPERVSEFHFDESLWQKLLDQIAEEQDRKITIPHSVLTMKFLFPQKDFKSFLTKEFWKGVKKSLAEYKDRSSGLWSAFAGEAMYLKLLAAEEIKSTDQGLEVIMQKEKPEFKEETPPMPQARKF